MRTPTHVSILAGLCPRLNRAVLPLAVLLGSTVAAAPPATAAGLPITFTLPAEKYVTIVVDDLRGNRIRNLVAEVKMAAGKHTIPWDGMDDYGHAASLGKYRWKGIYRDAIHQAYQMSAYDANASVPWFTTPVSKATDSGWLSDHNPPWSACAAGDKVFIGAITSENGQDMMALDLDGHKLWGISHPYSVGASEFAYDGKTVYAAGERQWAGKNANIWTIDPDTFATKQIAHLPDQGIRGLAVKDGKLYLSSDKSQAVLVIDPATGKVEKQIPLVHPGGLAVTKDDRMLAISGATIVELTDAGTGNVIVADHLTRPTHLAIGQDGTIYVTDGPTSWGTTEDEENTVLYGAVDVRLKGDNQVKVFGADGKFIRAIGEPGGRHEGLWNPQTMRLPVGIAVDSRNRIWVAEWDLLPKRISVWSPEGKLLKEFIGAHKYGGGGTLDPGDASKLIYDGNLMTLDWANAPKDPVHSWSLDATLAEIMPDLSPTAIPVHASPTRIMRFQGREYMLGGNGWSDLAGGLFYLWDGKNAKPCAYIGPSPVIKPGDYLYPRLVECIGTNPLGFGSEDSGANATPTNWGFDSLTMTWSDANGDGKMDPDEVSFTRQPFYWLRDTVFAPDLTAYMSNPAHRGMNSVWKIPMTGINAVGAPVWDIQHITTAVDQVPNTTTQGGYAATSTGRILIEGDPIYGVDPVAHTTWTYRNDWPDTGGGAPHEKPGLVIAGYNIRGVVSAGGELGNIFAVNSDFGQWYLFTADGLFVATLFGDCRTAPFWGTHLPEAKYGMLVDGVSLGQESFAGSLNRAPDGSIYIVAGHPHLSVIKLTGLDSVKRIEGILDVTASALGEAVAPQKQAVLDARKTGEPLTLTMWTAGRVGGSIYHPVVSTVVGGGALQPRLFLRYDDKSVWVAAGLSHFLDSGATPDLSLSKGDALVLDLAPSVAQPTGQPASAGNGVRVVIDSVAGKLRATAYFFGSASAPASIRVGTVTLAGYKKMLLLTDAEVTVTVEHHDMGTITRVSARIPWADLGLTPPSDTGPVKQLSGDLGIVVADLYGGASRRFQYADVFATTGDPAAAMKVDRQFWAVVAPQKKGM